MATKLEILEEGERLGAAYEELASKVGTLLDEYERLKAESTDVFLRELGEWQLATFPGQTPVGVYEHLLEEVAELGDDLSDRGELADCLMLLCCLCTRQGIDPVAVMREKHAINVKRVWANFRHVEDGQ